MTEQNRRLGMENLDSKRLRILISAYSCEPGRGSEPGVGWSMARALSRDHDVIVLTRKHKASLLARAVEAEQLWGKMEIIPFDLPRCRRLWQRGPVGAQSHYYMWQVGARGLARDIVRYQGVDLVHHLTFGRYWSPSCLAGLNAPFIWGPLGGGESPSSPFLPTLGARGRLYEESRDMARRGSRHDPLWKATVKNADVAIASTPETAARLRAAGCRRVEEFLQMGVDPVDVPEPSRRARDGGEFRVMSAGRLIPWKGIHLGISAFAAFARVHPGAVYWIAGDGPQRERLERQAGELGMGERVKFWGNLSRRAVLEMLGDADVFLHPSLHDQAPAAVFEAMLACKPVLCLDVGGPPIQVGARAGFVIEAREPGQAIHDLEAGLARLAANAALREEMGTAGRRRVLTYFTWDERARYIGNLYRKALANVPGNGRWPNSGRSIGAAA